MREESNQMKSNKVTKKQELNAKKERVKQIMVSIQENRDQGASESLSASVMQSLMEDEILNLFQNQIKRQIRNTKTLDRGEARK